jgi:hypothetical protein
MFSILLNKKRRFNKRGKNEDLTKEALLEKMGKLQE